MKKNHFIVNANKLLAAALTAGISFILAIVLLTMRRYGSVVVFLLVAIVFCLVSCVNGCVISVEADGVRKSLLGKTLMFSHWSEIKEIGVAGSKVFLNDDKQHVGTLYIYFSNTVMADEARFQMILKWPPSDKLYMTYSRERMLAVQLHWNGKIENYHAGPITFS